MENYKRKAKIHILLLFMFALLLSIFYYPFIQKFGSYTLLIIIVCCVIGTIVFLLSARIVYFSKRANMRFCIFIFSYFAVVSIIATLVIIIALIAGVSFIS